MIVLSLFDGMSCGQIALERAGIKVDKYYASEIDKFAMQITQKNYPDTIQLGSIENWEDWNIEKPDLIIGGSPCQGFSFAGKQLNFEDPRSKLFFVFKEILDHYCPDKFLMENVKMKKEYQDIITDNLYGMLPIEINSSLVSAQNRKRLYWFNWNVEQPEDKKIHLEDVLIDKSIKIGASRGRYIVNGIRQDARIKTQGLTKQTFELRPDFKSNTLTSVQKDNLVFIGGFKEGRRIDGEKVLSRQFREGYRLYHIKGKAATLTNYTKGGIGGYSGSYGDIENDGIIYYRSLEPIECERLQTVPDNYTEGVSSTQRYKMLGNGWTVDVIAHIFERLKQ